MGLPLLSFSFFLGGGIFSAPTSYFAVSAPVFFPRPSPASGFRLPGGAHLHVPSERGHAGADVLRGQVPGDVGPFQRAAASRCLQVLSEKFLRGSWELGVDAWFEADAHVDPRASNSRLLVGGCGGPPPKAV